MTPPTPTLEDITILRFFVDIFGHKLLHIFRTVSLILILKTILEIKHNFNTIVFYNFFIGKKIYLKKNICKTYLFTYLIFVDIHFYIS